MPVPDHERPQNRRDEYAETTRREVVHAARKLFAEFGYAQTTVDRIARDARVSPATVYAQCGGKEGLLGTLMDLWTTSNLVPSIIADCASVDSGPAKLRVLAKGYVAIYAESGDIIRIVTSAAASTSSAETFLKIADKRHQEALREIVQGVHKVGDLADGISVDDAVKIIFFHFRYPQFYLAADDFGWGVDRASLWITERIESAILKS
jgi:AcrR family transcriptional regulator